MGYNPQESLENTISTMGTLLGVHPIVPWMITFASKSSYIFTGFFTTKKSGSDGIFAAHENVTIFFWVWRKQLIPTFK